MKENNPFMAHQSSPESDNHIPSQALALNKKEQQQEGPFDKDVTKNPFASKTNLTKKEEIALQELVAEETGRERLKRHRVQVAGSVWIPETWGQEEMMKDWIDCTAFDAPLVPSRITTARVALVEEGRRANAAGLSIENRC